MMRKSTVVLIIVLSALMFYTGCDGDDGGDGGLPGAPGAMSPACEICPCKFFDVPMSAECWVNNSLLPRFNDGTNPPDMCQLFPDSDESRIEVDTDDPQNPQCVIGISIDFQNRCGFRARFLQITLDGPDEIDACRSCLGEYADRLDGLVGVEPDERFLPRPIMCKTP